MFEPENDIERLLMRASAEPAARPGFARALMDAQIFQVLVADCGPIVPGPDGKRTLPVGSKLAMPNATRGEERLVPFFTAPSRARTWFKGDHIVAPDTARDFFNRFQDAPFILNPGSDYGKEFTPAEVKRMLAGQFDEGPQTQVIEKTEQVLLAHPKEIPVDLIAALAREFEALPGMRGAWLMLAMREGASEQTWMLGVDHKGDWQDVRAALSRAVKGDVLNGMMLDAMPLNAGELSVTLRTGIPILTAAPKRGFIQKLFR
jgi:SseB protein C-terminal domain/SseB protein N-terminal domain